jgi:hypothetical protein
MSPRWGSKTRRTDWLVVGRNVTLTWRHLPGLASTLCFPTNWRRGQRKWTPDHFHVGRRTSPFQPACAQSLESEVPKRLDWEGQTNSLASQKPRSYPDGHCLWGYVKNCVYGEKMRDLQHLWERIATAIATVTPDIIQQTWHEIEYCLDVCLATNIWKHTRVRLKLQKFLSILTLESFRYV